ncbi:MAG: ABC transporter ATP-binding protein [Myxococcales bacterium]|nr:ABC transporter ATP-binding protein [Myxococcales bacterium]
MSLSSPFPHLSAPGVRNPLPVRVGLAEECLVDLLRCAAAACKREVTDRQIADALEGREPLRRRLSRAATALGMRLSSVTLTVSEAIDHSDDASPLFAVVGEREFLGLAGGEGDRARVLDRGGNVSLLAYDVAAKKLGLVGSNDEAVFFAFEPVALDGEIHGEHGHHVTPWQRLAALVTMERADLGAVVVYGVLVGVASLAVPVTAQALVGSVAMGTLLQPVVVLSTVLAAVLVFSAAVRVAQVKLVERLQERVFVHTAVRLAHRLTAARRDAFGNEHGPEQVNRFFDVLTIQKAAAALLLDGLAIALQLVVGLTLLAFYHPILLAFDVVLVGALVAIVWLLGRSAVETAIDESKAKYRVAAWLEEIAAKPNVFRGQSGSRLADQRSDALLRAYLEARRAHFAVVLRQTIGVLGLHAFASAAVLGIGAALVIGQKLTLGQLVAAEIVVNTVVAGIAKLGKYLESTYDLLAAVDKIGHLDDLSEERRDGAPLEHDAHFEVSVETGDVSLLVAPGERVGLSGSASERRAIFEALYGANDDVPPRVDGVPASELSLRAYRDAVVLVQGPEIFGGSVLENIRAGRDNVSIADARRALRTVGLDDAVSRLPHGVHTELRTDGAPLSADEATCLTFARALAARPRLLLVDGAFDNLPPALRAKLADAATNVGSSLVLATHDPAILARCDRVVGPTLSPSSHAQEMR